MPDPIINPITGQSFSASGLSGSGGYSNPITGIGDPDTDLLRLLQDRYNLSRSYSGFRTAEIGKLKTLPEDMIAKARERIPGQTQRSKEMQERMMSRYGAQMDGATRGDFLRRQDLEVAKGAVGSVNIAGRMGRELQTKGLSDYINIAQGISSDAMGTLSQGAKMDARRDSEYRQAKAARKASIYNTVGGFATTALMAFAF